MDKLEKDIEESLGRELKELGCLYLKFQSPGNAGVPDRIVIVPGGQVLFVELKKAGGQLGPLQQRWRVRISKMGGYHYVVDSEEKVMELARRIANMIPKQYKEQYWLDKAFEKYGAF